MLISIHVEGIRNVQQKLKLSADKLRDMRNFWKSVGMYVQKQTIKERFDKEQSPEGAKWKPLAPATIKHRQKRHKTSIMKILQDTGALRRSIAYEAGNNYVKVGSVLKYARIHQFGGIVEISRQGQYKRDHKNHRFKRKGNSYSYSHKVTIPARPFLGLTQAEKIYITGMFTHYVKRHLLGG